MNYESLRYPVFVVTCLVHLLGWAFVLIAFLHPSTTLINLYIVIPAIYLIHMLPWHPVQTLKGKLYRASALRRMARRLEGILVMPSVFGHFKKKLDEVCTYNPISVISVDGNDTDTGLPYSLAG